MRVPALLISTFQSIPRMSRFVEKHCSDLIGMADISGRISQVLPSKVSIVYLVSAVSSRPEVLQL